MEGILLDNDYIDYNGRPCARLFVKRGKETIAALDPSFEPYMYVVADDPASAAKQIRKLKVRERERTLQPKSVKLLERTFLGKKIEAIKVAFHRYRDMPALRHATRDIRGVKEIYEFDIPPSRRYLIDYGLVPMRGLKISGKVVEKDSMKTVLLDKPPQPVEVPEPDLNIMSFDIEVYNPTGTPRPDRDPIIMISLVDNRGLKKVITWKDFKAGLGYVEVAASEKEMLERFVELVNQRDIDILLGYNTDLFDFPYLRERAQHLKVKLKLGRDGSEPVVRRRRLATATRIRGRVHVDAYTMINFLATIGAIRLIRYTLEDVYKYMMGREKPHFDFTEFCEAWERGGAKAKRLLEYSMSDAQVTLEIGLELLPLFCELSRVVRQSLFDVTRMTPGQLVEWQLISEAYSIGELVPARPVGEKYRGRLEETYVGAYVMEPAKGLHEDLVVFDYRSLYPSIIVSHNIDLSTLNCKCCKGLEKAAVPELEYWFCTKRRGFIPAALEKLVKERIRVKREMERRKKGTKEYRSLHFQQWALKIIANSFYGMLGYPRARWFLRQCAESVTSFGRHYIRDTIRMAEEFGFDVIYADTDSLFCKLNGKTRVDVEKFLKQVNRSLPGIIELELEEFYKRGVFVTKKRYAMIDEAEKIVVKGLEFVRRDWATLAKKTQEAVLDAVLRKGSPEKAAEFVKKTTKDVFEKRVGLDDLVIYTQLTMPLEQYRAVGPHVAAARKLQAKGREIEPGMIVSYIIAKGSGSISERAIPIEDFKDMDYDPNYYVEHQVLPAVMRIMEVLGYREEDLRYERAKQVRLAEFTRD